MSVEAPERIWAARVTDSYGEWQTTTDGLLRPVEYVRADKLEELAAENHEHLRRNAELNREMSGVRRSYSQEKSLRIKAEAALAEKDKEIAVLREALEPFSRVADLIDVETKGLSEDDEIDLLFHDYLMDRYTVADFKRARNAGDNND